MRHVRSSRLSRFTSRLSAATGCLLVVMAMLCAGLVSPAAADSKWKTTTSAHFTAIGDAGDVRLREVLGRLEQFREVLRRVSPGLNLTPPLPIVVVVFETPCAPVSCPSTSRP